MSLSACNGVNAGLFIAYICVQCKHVLGRDVDRIAGLHGQSHFTHQLRQSAQDARGLLEKDYPDLVTFIRKLKFWYG